MDVATLFGIVAGLALICGSMALGGPIAGFVNGPGLLIVVGGTCAALFVKEALGNVLGSFRVMLNAILNRSQPPQTLVPMIVDLSMKARKEGLIALEGEDIGDTFLSRGVQLGVDGLSSETIKSTLLSELNALRQRHQRGQKLFRFLGATAPAMGMIGTLIGLVQMLGTLEDPSSIGPSMAVALLTTLYGAILANMVFSPMAAKLERNSNEESLVNTVFLTAAASMGRQENPRRLEMLLNTFLPPAHRLQYYED